MPFAAVAGCGGRLADVDPRRQIPPIHRLDAPALGRLIELYGRGPVTIHLGENGAGR
jgi:hypothetical protein